MPAPHEVQAVLIDLDGTLIDSEFAWREAFYDTWAPVYARHPELRERCGEPSTLYDAVYQPLIRAQTAGREWRPEFVREAFAGIIAQHIDGHIAAPGDDGTLATTLYEQYYEAWPAHIVPYPEVRETLEALSGRVRLAIVTNGQSDEQRQKVELSGLGAYFEVVTVSEEVDSLKPDPAIFHHTLERLGVAPTSAITSAICSPQTSPAQRPPASAPSGSTATPAPSTTPRRPRTRRSRRWTGCWGWWGELPLRREPR